MKDKKRTFIKILDTKMKKEIEDTNLKYYINANSVEGFNFGFNIKCDNEQQLTVEYNIPEKDFEILINSNIKDQKKFIEVNVKYIIDNLINELKRTNNMHYFHRTGDCINNYNDWYKGVWLEQGGNEDFSKEDTKYIWLCTPLDIVTYDDAISYELGRKLYKVIKAILNRTQEQFMAKGYSQEYVDYVTCLNLLGTDNLEWGTSIRYCWFKDKEKYRKLIEQVERK